MIGILHGINFNPIMVGMQMMCVIAGIAACANVLASR
jgi:hypothetical protein